jgi:hypothetical protein
MIIYSAFVKYLSKNVNALKNGLKHRDALLPLLFNFALVYAIRRVQVNQDCLKLNGTHQLLVFADDVNILGRSIHNIKKNTEFFLMSHRACYHTCFTIQRVHYSHSKTQSLQHL